MDFIYDNPSAPPNSPVILPNTSTQNEQLTPVPGVAHSKAPLEVHVIPLTDPSTISIHVNTATSTNSNTEIDDLSADFFEFSIPSKAGSRDEPRHRPHPPPRVKTKHGGIQKRVRFSERTASDTKKLRENFKIDPVACEKSRQERRVRRRELGKIRKMYLLSRKQELENEVRETTPKRMRQGIGDVAEKEGGDDLEALRGTKVDNVADDVLDMFGKMQIDDRAGDVRML